MIFEPLAKKLADARIGKLGESIFVYQAPVTSEEFVLFRDSFVGTDIDPYTDVREGNFEVVCFGKDLLAGREKAVEVSEILTMQGETLSGMDKTIEVKLCRPLHEPVMFHSSEGGNFEWAVTFSIYYAIIG